MVYKHTKECETWAKAYKEAIKAEAEGREVDRVVAVRRRYVEEFQACRQANGVKE